VGLCFSRLAFFFLFGTARVGGGLPTCSRAAAFTAFTARNAFDFFRFGKGLYSLFGTNQTATPDWARQLCNNRLCTAWRL